MGVQFQGFREQDDKCFHPSALSPSVSLLVRSERGSVRSRCQEDKPFCAGSKAGAKKKKRNVMYRLSALGWKPVEDVCFNKSFQQVIKVFSCFLQDTRVVFFSPFGWRALTHSCQKNAQSSKFVKGLHSDPDQMIKIAGCVCQIFVSNEVKVQQCVREQTQTVCSTTPC